MNLKDIYSTALVVASAPRSPPTTTSPPSHRSASSSSLLSIPPAAAMDALTPPSTHHLLQIHLISAQGLKSPGGQRRMQCYAVAWADPAAKVRTCTDLYYGENPYWSESFVFRVPPAFLHRCSPSGVTIEIYTTGRGWCLRDSLVGTACLLVGCRCLVAGSPGFADIGIYHNFGRNFGRINGVLNVGATLLDGATALAVEALSGSPAFSYGDIIWGSGRRPSQAARLAELKKLPISYLISGSPSPAAERAVVKELNGDNSMREGKGEREVLNRENSRREGKTKDESEVWGGGAAAGTLCGLGFPPRRIHLSPSVQNLQISGAWWTVTIFLLVLTGCFLRVVM